MKKKICLILVLCLILALFGGCGKKETESKEPVKEMVEEAADSVETDEAIAAEPEANEETEEMILPEKAAEEEETVEEETKEETAEPTGDITVVNNAHYFVKVGDRVYFREYGVRALENPTIFGHYLLTPTGDSSHIDYYDEARGTTVQAFEDFGYGNIAYLDGKFFLNGIDFSSSEYGDAYIYAVDPEGKEVRLPEIIHGTIKGVSEKNDMLFMENSYVGNTYEPIICGITGDGNKAFSIESDTELSVLGSMADYLIYAENYFEMGKPNVSKIQCCNIYSGDTVQLMEITCEYEEAFDFGEIFESDGDYYLPVVIRAGSGSMFQSGAAYKFVPGEADSGVEAESFTASEYDDTPYVTIGGKERALDDKAVDTYFVDRVSFDAEADLCVRKSSGEKEVAVKNFIPAADYYDTRNDMTLAESVDGTGYIMFATQVYDPEGSIGWRDGFRLLKMEYLRLNGEGGYDIIQTVVYE